METVKFTVEKHGRGIFRITANDIRSKYRAFNTGMITDIDALFYSMSEIEEDLKNDCIVLFNTFDFTTQN